MASKFVLTAQLQIQAPTNVKAIVNKLRKDLSDIKADVSITGLEGTNKNIAKLTKSLQGMGGTTAHLSRSMADLGDAVAKGGTRIKKTADATKNAEDMLHKFGKSAGLAAKRYSAFLASTTIFLKLISALNEGVKAAVSFEREMIKVAQVTGKSASELRDLTNAVTRLSTGLGVASSDLANVSRVLSQAGLTARDTRIAMEALAKTALAPTFQDINKTTEVSIAILSQFGRGVENLKSQLGAINAVAGQFAVEAGDLGVAVRRAGGAFTAAGGSLEELIALFTSVRSTTRETAETIATGFRTIFTRIRRPKTIQFLKRFGVELQNLEGHFIGPYEAVRRLHSALKDLDPRDVRFAQVIEELGGFRQVSKVIPLIQQFEKAEKARQVAMAGGSSIDKDAAKAKETLAVKISQVQEEFTALIRKVTESTTFKVVADMALKMASAFIKIADALTPLLPLITSLAAVKLGGMFAGMVGGGAGGGGGLGQLLGGFKEGIKAAGGGLVPGRGNKDTVPAALTPGEFVIRKKAVKKIGLDRLSQMNRYGSGGRVRFNDGGEVLTKDEQRMKDEQRLEVLLEKHAVRLAELRGQKSVSGAQDPPEHELFKGAGQRIVHMSAKGKKMDDAEKALAQSRKQITTPTSTQGMKSDPMERDFKEMRMLEKKLGKGYLKAKPWREVELGPEDEFFSERELETIIRGSSDWAAVAMQAKSGLESGRTEGKYTEEQITRIMENLNIANNPRIKDEAQLRTVLGKVGWVGNIGTLNQERSGVDKEIMSSRIRAGIAAAMEDLGDMMVGEKGFMKDTKHSQKQIKELLDEDKTLQKNLADAEGNIFETQIRVFDKVTGGDPGEAGGIIDFPKGLSETTAGSFDIPKNMPADAKRTIGDIRTGPGKEGLESGVALPALAIQMHTGILKEVLGLNTGGKVFGRPETGWVDEWPSFQTNWHKDLAAKLHGGMDEEIWQTGYGAPATGGETKIINEQEVKRVKHIQTKTFMDKITAATKERMGQSDYIWENLEEVPTGEFAFPHWSGRPGPEGYDWQKASTEKRQEEMGETPTSRFNPSGAPTADTRRVGSVQKYQESTGDIGSLLAGRYKRIAQGQLSQSKIEQVIKAVEQTELMDRAMKPMQGSRVETRNTLEKERRGDHTMKENREMGTVFHGIFGDRAESLKEQLSKGNTFSFPGYMSTSVDPGMSDNWRALKGENQQLMNGIIEIALKDDFMASDMRMKGSMGDEQEILLPRNSKFKATDIKGLFEQKTLDQISDQAEIQFLSPFLVKAQQLNKGGEAEDPFDLGFGGGTSSNHYAVSSDSAAFKSWGDLMSFMADIKEHRLASDSPSKPKINFVAGASGAGKSHATSSLATITDRAAALREGTAFTFEFGGAKFENMADLVKLVSATGGQGYWIQAGDETVREQRASRLAQHVPTDRDARPLGQMKGAAKGAKLPSELSDLVAELSKNFPELQKVASSSDVKLMAKGGIVEKLKEMASAGLGTGLLGGAVGGPLGALLGGALGASFASEEGKWLLEKLGIKTAPDVGPGPHFLGEEVGFAKGGPVGTDTVPALLTPGEFVINKASAEKIGYSKLMKMNKYAKGGVVQKFQEGGAVGGGGMGIDSLMGLTAAASAVASTFVEADSVMGVGLGAITQYSASLASLNTLTNAAEKTGLANAAAMMQQAKATTEQANALNEAYKLNIKDVHENAEALEHQSMLYDMSSASLLSMKEEQEKNRKGMSLLEKEIAKGEKALSGRDALVNDERKAKKLQLIALKKELEKRRGATEVLEEQMTQQRSMMGEIAATEQEMKQEQAKRIANAEAMGRQTEATQESAKKQQEAAKKIERATKNLAMFGKGLNAASSTFLAIGGAMEKLANSALDSGKTLTAVGLSAEGMLAVGKAATAAGAALGETAQASMQAANVLGPRAGIATMAAGIVVTAFMAVKAYGKGLEEAKDKILSSQIDKELELAGMAFKMASDEIADTWKSEDHARKAGLKIVKARQKAEAISDPAKRESALKSVDKAAEQSSKALYAMADKNNIKNWDQLMNTFPELIKSMGLTGEELKEFRKDMESHIETRQKMKAAEERHIAALKEQQKDMKVLSVLTTGFVRMGYAVQKTTEAISQLGTFASGGLGTTQMTDFSSIFDDMGAMFNTSLFDEQLGLVTDALGKAGPAIDTRVRNIGSALDALPQVLMDAVDTYKMAFGTGAENFPMVVEDLLTENLGPAFRDTEVGKMILANIPTTGKALEDLIADIEKNPAEAAKKLGQAFQPFIAQIQNANSLIVKHINSLGAAFANRTKLEMDIISKRVSMQKSSFADEQKIAKLRARGRPVTADIGAARDAAGTRQTTILGAQAGMAGDPAKMGKELGRLQSEIRRRTGDLANLPIEDRTKEIAAIEDLRRNIGKVNAALKDMTDIASQSAAIEQELGKIRKESGTKLSVLTEFTFGDKGQRQAQAQTLFATKMAAITGDIEKIPGSMRGGVKSMLDKFKDIKIFGTGKTGREITADLNVRTAKRLFASMGQQFTPDVEAAIREASTPKEEKLIDDLSKLHAQRHNAELAQVQNMGQIHKDMGIEIQNANATFLQELSSIMAKLPDAVKAGLGGGGGGGGAVTLAAGGSVFEPRGTDTVPAMLTPGEFVVNAGATKKNLSTLKSINRGDVIYRAGGGITPGTKDTGLFSGLTAGQTPAGGEESASMLRLKAGLAIAKKFGLEVLHAKDPYGLNYFTGEDIQKYIGDGGAFRGTFKKNLDQLMWHGPGGIAQRIPQVYRSGGLGGGYSRNKIKGGPSVFFKNSRGEGKSVNVSKKFSELLKAWKGGVTGGVGDQLVERHKAVKGFVGVGQGKLQTEFNETMAKLQGKPGDGGTDIPSQLLKYYGLPVKLLKGQMGTMRRILADPDFQKSGPMGDDIVKSFTKGLAAGMARLDADSKKAIESDAGQAKDKDKDKKGFVATIAKAMKDQHWGPAISDSGMISPIEEHAIQAYGLPDMQDLKGWLSNAGVGNLGGGISSWFMNWLDSNGEGKILQGTANMWMGMLKDQTGTVMGGHPFDELVNKGFVPKDVGRNELNFEKGKLGEILKTFKPDETTKAGKAFANKAAKVKAKLQGFSEYAATFSQGDNLDHYPGNLQNLFKSFDLLGEMVEEVQEQEEKATSEAVAELKAVRAQNVKIADVGSVQGFLQSRLLRQNKRGTLPRYAKKTGRVGGSYNIEALFPSSMGYMKAIHELNKSMVISKAGMGRGFEFDLPMLKKMREGEGKLGDIEGITKHLETLTQNPFLSGGGKAEFMYTKRWFPEAIMTMNAVGPKAMQVLSMLGASGPKQSDLIQNRAEGKKVTPEAQKAAAALGIPEDKQDLAAARMLEEAQQNVSLLNIGAIEKFMSNRAKKKYKPGSKVLGKLKEPGYIQKQMPSLFHTVGLMEDLHKNLWIKQANTNGFGWNMDVINAVLGSGFPGGGLPEVATKVQDYVKRAGAYKGIFQDKAEGLRYKRFLPEALAAFPLIDAQMRNLANHITKGVNPQEAARDKAAQDERERGAAKAGKAAQNAQRKNTGGMITGPSGVDVVPAMLTAGEYVINKNSAQAIGLGNLNALNRAQKFNKGGLVRYRQGGSNGPEVPANGTIEIASEDFDRSVNDFATLIDSFGQFVTGGFVFTGTFNHTVNVTINGAEAFSTMEPQFAGLAVGAVQSSIDKLLKDKFPGVFRDAQTNIMGKGG